MTTNNQSSTMLQMPCFRFCLHLKHHPYEQH
jgi:hypothetical protein